jgi:hypothetical protein
MKPLRFILRFLAPCLLFAGTLLIQAQENGEQETRTWAAVSDHTDYLFSNGKAWRALDAKSKITELEGIEQGMMMLVRETYPRLSPADRALLDEEPLKLMVKGFRMSDVAEQLDAYYKDSSNLRVPIAEAYKYSILKMRGARQKELDDLAASLRSKYNR